jgi:hypothetical protein
VPLREHRRKPCHSSPPGAAFGVSQAWFVSGPRRRICPPWSHDQPQPPSMWVMFRGLRTGSCLLAIRVLFGEDERPVLRLGRARNTPAKVIRAWHRAAWPRNRRLRGLIPCRAARGSLIGKKYVGRPLEQRGRLCRLRRYAKVAAVDMHGGGRSALDRRCLVVRGPAGWLVDAPGSVAPGYCQLALPVLLGEHALPVRAPRALPRGAGSPNRAWQRDSRSLGARA